MKTSGYLPNSHGSQTKPLWDIIQAHLTPKSGYKKSGKSYPFRATCRSFDCGSLAWFPQKQIHNLSPNTFHPKSGKKIQSRKTFLSRSRYGHWLVKSIWCSHPYESLHCSYQEYPQPQDHLLVFYLSKRQIRMLSLQPRHIALQRSAGRSTSRIIHITPNLHFFVSSYPNTCKLVSSYADDVNAAVSSVNHQTAAISLVEHPDDATDWADERQLQVSPKIPHRPLHIRNQYKG